MIERAGIEAKLGFKTHPHMLRVSGAIDFMMAKWGRL
jgi:hypothetical protein